MGGDHIIGFQYAFAHKLEGRQNELSPLTSLIVRARTTSVKSAKAKFSLINGDAVSFSTFINLSDQFADIEIPLTSLHIESSLLLPRPYPGFLPLWFKASDAAGTFRLQDAEKLELTIGSDLDSSALNKPSGIEIENIWLQRNK